MFKKFKGKFKSILGSSEEDEKKEIDNLNENSINSANSENIESLDDSKNLEALDEINNLEKLKQQRDTQFEEDLSDDKIVQLEKDLEKYDNNEGNESNDSNDINNDKKENSDEENKEEPQVKKRGFFSKLFGKKDEESKEEIIEENVSENIGENKKEANNFNLDKIEDDEEKEESDLFKTELDDVKTETQSLRKTLEVDEEKYKEEDNISIEEKEKIDEIEKKIEDKKENEILTKNLNINSNEREDEKDIEKENLEEKPKDDETKIIEEISNKKIQNQENIEKNIKEEKKDVNLEEVNTTKQTQNIETQNVEEINGNEEESDDVNYKDEEDYQDEEREDKRGFLSRTFGKLKSKKIDEDDFDRIWLELEIFLLEINVAYDIVEKIKDELNESIIGKEFTRFKLRTKIKEVLIKEISQILKTREGNFLNKIKTFKLKPIKILILGINGTGKTTTIAKLVNYFRANNLETVVSASDTFRAAAVEQLEEHSNRLGFKLVKHSKGSDSVAVAFDAIKHAQTKNKDVVLIDTAGRMSNDSNLMKELEKMQRVLQPDLTLIIGDSNSGNDLKIQIEHFDKALNIDGVILTKVDTDERPGSIVTAAYTIDRPIYFLGTGQNYEDLEIFDGEKIAHHLFDDE